MRKGRKKNSYLCRPKTRNPGAEFSQVILGTTWISTGLQGAEVCEGVVHWPTGVLGIGGRCAVTSSLVGKLTVKK